MKKAACGTPSMNQTPIDSSSFSHDEFSPQVFLQDIVSRHNTIIELFYPKTL